MKKNGYLLLEFCLSLALFSICIVNLINTFSIVPHSLHKQKKIRTTLTEIDQILLTANEKDQVISVFGQLFPYITYTYQNVYIFEYIPEK